MGWKGSSCVFIWLDMWPDQILSFEKKSNTIYGIFRDLPKLNIGIEGGKDLGYLKIVIENGFNSTRDWMINFLDLDINYIWLNNAVTYWLQYWYIMVFFWIWVLYYLLSSALLLVLHFKWILVFIKELSCFFFGKLHFFFFFVKLNKFNPWDLINNKHRLFKNWLQYRYD